MSKDAEMIYKRAHLSALYKILETLPLGHHNIDYYKEKIARLEAQIA